MGNIVYSNMVSIIIMCFLIGLFFFFILEKFVRNILDIGVIIFLFGKNERFFIKLKLLSWFVLYILLMKIMLNLVCMYFKIECMSIYSEKFICFFMWFNENFKG